MKNPATSKWVGVGVARRKFADDAVPKTAFSLYEYAERYKLGIKAAETQLAQMAREGALKTGKRRAQTEAGLRWLRFYWIPVAKKAAK